MSTERINRRCRPVRATMAGVCTLTALTLVLICVAGCVTATATPEPGVTPMETPVPTGVAADCLDFEDLRLGADYHVPDRFMDSDIGMTVRAFQWGNGQWTTDGFAEVDDQGHAGGSGQEMTINNVNLDFDFCCVLEKGLTLRFGEYGGNLNIEINGIFQNFENFADIDGANFSGVVASVTNGLGNDMGTLTLKGQIWSFALGGQELWIDDVCPMGCMVIPKVIECVDFEDPPLNQRYGVLDSFQDSGATIRVAAFQSDGGDWDTAGYARVSADNAAGGSDQEMWLGGVNLDFKFPGCRIESLVVYFGEYGGNVNLDINGEFRSSDDFLDFDGQIIGGVEVRVVDGEQNVPGKMELTGEMRSFAMGGQELAIDNVCPGQ
jgi:hypothetical protein